jgi:hypothetical protein
MNMKGAIRFVAAIHTVLTASLLGVVAFAPSHPSTQRRPSFLFLSSSVDLSPEFTSQSLHDEFIRKNTEAVVDVIASSFRQPDVVVGPQRVLIYDTTLRGTSADCGNGCYWNGCMFIDTLSTSSTQTAPRGNPSRPRRRTS